MFFFIYFLNIICQAISRSIYIYIYIFQIQISSAAANNIFFIPMNHQESTINSADYKFKIVFLGDSSVGKTSIVQNILFGKYNQNQQPTIFIQSAKKNVFHNQQHYQLMLWDTAGQQKFNSLIPSFVRGSNCAVIVFDLANKESFESCEKWIKLAQGNSSQNQPAFVLVGNKSDLDKVAVSSKAIDLSLKYKCSYIETSAKTGKGIQKVVMQIIESIQRGKSKSENETKSSEGSLNSSRKLTKSVSIKSEQVKLKKSSCCQI